MKRIAIAGLLFFAACKPKPTLRVTETLVDAGPVDAGVIRDAAASTAALDAAPEASAPETTREEEGPPPSDLTLTVVASFSTYVKSVHLFHVTDGVAIAQSNGVDWSVLTASKTKPLEDLTKTMRRDHGGSDPFWLWGSVDEVWVTDGKTRAVHASRTADPAETQVFRHVAHYRDDQWVGVPTAYPLWYMSDMQPNRFEQLRPSDVDAGAEVPIVPKDIQLWGLTSLGDGKLCGAGMQSTDAGNAYVVWTWSSSTNTKVIDVPKGDSFEEPLVFRGLEGDCFYVNGGMKTLSVRRLRGNHVVPVADGLEHGAADATASGDALWLTQDKTQVLRRIDLTKNPVQTKKYALPTNVAGCKKLGDATDIVATADDDVWVLMSCESPAHEVLLHTEPAGATVAHIPSPK